MQLFQLLVLEPKIDYNNFAVDLAGKDKFQEAGIKFNPRIS